MARILRDDQKDPENPWGAAPTWGGYRPNQAAEPLRGQGPSGWINLQSMFDLNEDQSKKMAEDVHGGVERRAQEAQQGIRSAERGFNKQLEAGVGQAPTQYDAGATAAEAGAKAGRSFSGPRSLYDANPNLGAQVAAAAQGVRLSKTAGGQQQLLESQYGGQASPLDAFFMGKARPQGVGGGWDALESQFDIANRLSAERSGQAEASGAANARAWGQLRDQALAKEKESSATQKESARRAAFQSSAAASKGRGDLRKTVSVTDSELAAMDGRYAEWVAAGSPPYDAWKRGR